MLSIEMLNFDSGTPLGFMTQAKCAELPCDVIPKCVKLMTKVAFSSVA